MKWLVQIFTYNFQMKHKVADELNKFHHISITTDAWTSQATTSYLMITVHAIDNEWILISRVLQTREFPQTHDEKHIKQLIR